MGNFFHSESVCILCYSCIQYEKMPYPLKQLIKKYIFLVILKCFMYNEVKRIKGG